MKTHQLVTRHCGTGGSDKVWAGGVLEDEGTFSFLSCWGARGLNLQHKRDSFPSLEAALKALDKKAKEKVPAKGYVDCDWTNPYFGLEKMIRQLFPDLAETASSSSTPVVLQAPVTDLGQAVSHVLPMRREELEAAIENPHIGITEKVNGVRCPVQCKNGVLTSYNRLGQAQPTLPRGVEALLDLEKDFLIDGERMREGYVMFDLLEWDGQSIRSLPYEERITALVVAIEEAATILEQYGPCQEDSIPATPEAEGLALLSPATFSHMKQATVRLVEQAGGEGVILRDLRGPSVQGNTKYERKVKFQGEIDCAIVGVNKTRLDKSFRLGLYRSDGSIIEVGNLRSGFTGSDFAAVEASLALGLMPVVSVEFLPARTVGITLVEPKSGRDKFRTDKLPRDCTTDQLTEILGENRQSLIDAAKAA